MTDKITPNHPKLTSTERKEWSIAKEFRFELVSDAQHAVMTGAFFIAAFIIYFQIQVTLISLIEASQIFVLLGLIGFGISFLFRFRFNLTLLDGLYYNTFVAAPMLLAAFLSINSFCENVYTESYRVIALTSGGSGFVYELENDAYSEFWRIRNFHEPPARVPEQMVTYTFCDGVFGYKVLRGTE